MRWNAKARRVDPCEDGVMTYPHEKSLSSFNDDADSTGSSSVEFPYFRMFFLGARGVGGAGGRISVFTKIALGPPSLSTSWREEI